MLCVAAMWAGSFLIPIYYSAFIDLFSYFAFQALFGYFYKYQANKRRVNLIALIMALIINLIFIYLLYTIFSGVNLLMCYLLIITTAIGAWKYKTISFAFKDTMPTTFLIASRFYLLLLIAGVIVIIKHPVAPGFRDIMETLLISLSSLILPIYFSQKSIENLSPINNSIGSSFAPFLVLIIERVLNINKMNSITEIYMSLALIVVLLFPLYVAERSKKS